MRKSEVWFVDLPEGKGHEQKGERPAIVLGRANDLTIVVPLTSNLDTATFSFAELIEQTPENGLSTDSIALVFQIMGLDNSRFKRKLGAISKEKQDAIDKLILEMLKITQK
ncbi:MAG: type II toxin-antitoxin system PemK/MazF family toxin [Candidatus Diapherotrites archaeon]|nr:type II toxin-antitoxin system PemK/MazF family toxin [Candidatus Diapherotrites archaeon]